MKTEWPDQLRGEEMSKFTPGPWSNSLSGVWSVNGRICRSENGAESHYRQLDKQEQEANERLIAAAPELLQACIAFMDYNVAYPKARELAIAAIQIATQETQLSGEDL